MQLNDKTTAAVLVTRDIDSNQISSLKGRRDGGLERYTVRKPSETVPLGHSAKVIPNGAGLPNFFHDCSLLDITQCSMTVGF